MKKKTSDGKTKINMVYSCEIALRCLFIANSKEMLGKVDVGQHPGKKGVRHRFTYVYGRKIWRLLLFISCN